MKKTLSLIATGALVLTSTSFAAFKDVNRDDWFNDAVEYVSQNQILNGIGADLFAPRENMSRAMVAQALYNIEDRPEVKVENTYKDVEKGKWYEKAILWATENKLAKGVAENEFAPNKLITKEQMVTILNNYLKYKGKEEKLEEVDMSEFKDIEDISKYALEPMKWAVKNKILVGSEGKLNPKKPLIRAEVATIIRNFDNIYPRHDVAWVELKGATSGGYTWTASGYDEEIVKVTDNVYYDRNEEGLVGQVGNFKFRIKAKKPGKTTVKFTYKRPWEDKIISEAECKVEVDENNIIHIEHSFDK